MYAVRYKMTTGEKVLSFFDDLEDCISFTNKLESSNIKYTSTKIKPGDTFLEKGFIRQ